MQTWAGALLEVRDLSVRAGGRALLERVDLTAEPGAWVGVIGAAGSGKSTLLRTLAGQVRHEGSVLVDGTEVDGLSAREREHGVAYLPQCPPIPDSGDVREYLTRGRGRRPGQLTDRRGPRLQELITRLDLDGLDGRPMRCLSAAHRQLAAVARHLVGSPRLMLLDEPTDALGTAEAWRLADALDQLRREERLTLVTALHDLNLAGRFPDRLVLLDGGRVAADGPPAQVLTPALLAEHLGVQAEVAVDRRGVRVQVLGAVRCGSVGLLAAGA